MAFVLRLVSTDKTVDFMSTAYQLEDGGFELELPDRDQVWGNESRLSLGAQLIANRLKNRNLKITFTLRASTRAQLVQNVFVIEQLFYQAREYSMTGEGSRVALEYSWDGLDHTVYFEVLDGVFNYPEDVMSVEKVLQYDGVNYFISENTVELIMIPLAYGVSPVNGNMIEIPLSNSILSNVTGGIDVYSHDDSHPGHDNWVEIRGLNIPGNYPTITKVSITGVNMGSRPGRVTIGLQRKRSIKHIYEDTDAAYAYARSVASDSDASGGQYSLVSFDQTDPAKIMSWHITTPQEYAAQPYRVIAVGAVGHPWDRNCNYCITITPAGLDDVLFRTDWISPTAETIYLDLGLVFLPPFHKGLPNVANLDIHLMGFRKGEGTEVISVDYLQLIPVQDGYRVLQNRLTDAPVSFGTTFVDDAWNKVVYVSDGTNSLGIIDGLFQPVRLMPGLDQRLYFLFGDRYTSAQPAGFHYKVQVWITPLYLILA